MWSTGEGNGKPLQYSCLENPINSLKREWLPTPVFLPGEFQGQRSLAGYSPWGCRVGQTEWLTRMRALTHTPTRLTELVFLKLEYGNLPFKTGNWNNSEIHLGLRTTAFWWNRASTAVKHRFNSKCSFTIPANNQLQYCILTAWSVDFNLCDNILLYGLI